MADRFAHDAGARSKIILGVSSPSGREGKGRGDRPRITQRQRSTSRRAAAEPIK